MHAQKFRQHKQYGIDDSNIAENDYRLAVMSCSIQEKQKVFHSFSLFRRREKQRQIDKWPSSPFKSSSFIATSNMLHLVTSPSLLSLFLLKVKSSEREIDICVKSCSPKIPSIYLHCCVLHCNIIYTLYTSYMH